MQLQASTSDYLPDQVTPDQPKHGKRSLNRSVGRDLAMRSGAPVDLVHLARHTLGNRDLEREVLVLFQRQSACYVRRLKMADNTEEQCAAAHIIKGSSRGIGAWRVADLAEAVEAAYMEGRIDADLLVDHLSSAIEDANAYIGELLSA